MPLTEEARAIIKSTVPLLEAGGEVLTKHFYGIMLTEFPEVVPFFNKAHQVSGDQPRALARAVLGYAKHIDNLEAIGPVAGQIIHKHVSLSVRAEHYPIVGKCLLRAMTEVLGKDVATTEVLDAWGAAYQQLADILIAAEEGIYVKNAMALGGWRDEREFVLEKKVKESDEISSFYWRPKDGGSVMEYQPGQYLGVIVRIDGQIYRRNYSLSQSFDPAVYRISVKLEHNGVMSTYLHNMNPGDSISFFPPVGDFVLQPSERPLVLLGAGVGITPLIPMMEKTLKDTTRPVHFIYTTRNSKVQPFQAYIEEMVHKYPGRFHFTNYHSQQDPNHHRRLGKDDLQNLLPENPDVYFVGPKPFLKDMKRYLLELNIPTSQCYYEFFGPASDL